MKKQKQSYHKIILLLCILVTAITVLQGCKKFLNLPLSPTLVETGKLFNDDKAAGSAILGLFNQTTTAMQATNGGLSVYTGLYADDLYNTTSSSTYDPFASNTLLVNNSVVQSSFWTNGYTCIYQANAIIEGLGNSTALTPAVKKQLMGEAKFIRAWHYFNLLQLFGDVPLVSTTNYQQNMILPRAPVSEIYQFILADLVEAKTLLSETYPTAGKLRPNKWAATALLARTALYMNNWQQAYDNAGELLNTGAYQLSADLNNSFAANNSEAIWQISRDNANPSEAGVFIPSSATVKPTLALTPSLMQLFEAGDKRKAAWAKTNTVSAVQYDYPNKYKIKAATPVSEYKQPLRLAEVVLIRAEAAIYLGKTDTALAGINRIRSRAGLAAISFSTTAQLVNALEKERRLEFFAEDAHRWFDLKRWNKAEAVLSSLKLSWTNKALLFPVPVTEIDKNPFLLQNPGY